MLVLWQETAVLSVVQGQGLFPCFQECLSVNHRAGGMLFRVLGPQQCMAISSVLSTQLGESCLTQTTTGSEASQGCGFFLELGRKVSPGCVKLINYPTNKFMSIEEFRK